MNTISNRDASVLLLLNIADLPNGNTVGDAHVVLDDGRVVSALNISADDRPYYVLHLCEAGTATLCDVVSAHFYDAPGTGSSVQRLRVEVSPVADAPKVEVMS